MFFKYKGYEQNGTRIKGLIEAVNLDEAKAKIKAKNIFLLFIEDAQPRSWKWSKFSTKIQDDELAKLSKNISIYLQSGISLMSALELLKNTYESKKMVLFLDDVIVSLRGGNTLFNSFMNQKYFVLPEFYLQSIKIAETSGSLEQVLSELSQYLYEQYKLTKQIQTSLIYPIFIIFVSLSMVTFMLMFIVPKITEIFVKNQQELPLITKIVIAVGDFVGSYIQIILVGLLVFVMGIVWGYKQGGIFKEKIDLLTLKIPFFGKVIEYNQLSKFCYVNSVLIRSSIPIVRGMQLSANILTNAVMQKLFVEATKKVVEGDLLSKTLIKLDGIYKLDKSFIQALSIGEESSELAQMLDGLKQFYNEQNKERTALFLSFLEPVMMLLVGGMIGVIVLAMLLPIFGMNIG